MEIKQKLLKVVMTSGFSEESFAIEYRSIFIHILDMGSNVLAGTKIRILT